MAGGGSGGEEAGEGLAGGMVGVEGMGGIKFPCVGVRVGGGGLFNCGGGGGCAYIYLVGIQVESISAGENR